MTTNPQAATTSAAVSRAHLARRAVRPAMPARLMLSSPGGGGKTWTSLVIARELVGPDGDIVVIDTETESALLYADEHVFEHIRWEAPYDPQDLAATIRELETNRSRCIIIDSTSHFWTGAGGTLDIADGRFGGWKTATPAQDEMVDAIMKCKSHVIGCTREKTAYLVGDKAGKQTVEKIGLAPVQREGLDYEFNVHATMDMAHNLSIGKTRCRMLAGKVYRPNHADEMARIYGDWLEGGHPLISKEQATVLRGRAKALPGPEQGSDIRNRCSAEFKDAFGSADNLLAQDLPEAEAMLARYEAEAWPDGKPETAATPAPVVEPVVEPVPAEIDGDGPLLAEMAAAGEPELVAAASSNGRRKS
jgi:hypothetical protein